MRRLDGEHVNTMHISTMHMNRTGEDAVHVSVRGVRLHVVEEGAGPPVLLVHGLGGNARLWDAQLADLGRTYRVLAVDQRGFGASDRTYGEMELSDWADDLAGLLQALDLGPTVVVGHSMGGMVAQELAVRAPELLAGLIVASTMPGASARHVEINNSLAELALREGSGPFSAALVGGCFTPATIAAGERCVTELERAVAATDPLVLAIALRAVTRFDVRAALPLVAVPTHVIVGAQDALLEDSREIARLIPGAGLTVMADTAHCPNLERSAEFSRIVGGFLSDRPRWS